VARVGRAISYSSIKTTAIRRFALFYRHNQNKPFANGFMVFHSNGINNLGVDRTDKLEFFGASNGFWIPFLLSRIQFFAANISFQFFEFSPTISIGLLLDPAFLSDAIHN